MDAAIISAKREDRYCAFRIPMALAETPVFLRRGRRSGKRFSTLGRRHYDPTVGRFLEPDSAQWLDPKRFGGINPYAYCLNDPITKEDPSGLLASGATALSSKIRVPGLNSGRGSYLSVSKQIVTKFRNGTISRITLNTFSKILTLNLVESLADGVVNGVTDAFGFNDSLSPLWHGAAAW